MVNEMQAHKRKHIFQNVSLCTSLPNNALHSVVTVICANIPILYNPKNNRENLKFKTTHKIINNKNGINTIIHIKLFFIFF